MSKNKIMLVGEAWGEHEEQQGQPFVGSSGYLLNSMLAQVGISRSECFITNVFNLRPASKNDVESFCGSKETALPGYPALKPGKYVRTEFAPELARLYRQIRDENPNLIVALGASAAWALLGTSGIKKIRGAPAALSGPALASVGRAVKVLPTYHPSAIMRDWSLRAIAIMDLFKAVDEATSPEITRPKREIWVEPTIADLELFERLYIDCSDSLSVDIETAGGQITCIGFAPDIHHAIVVPLIDPTQRDGNYWRSLKDELTALSFVRRWLSLAKRVVGQNFNYDMHHLWKSLGLTVPGAEDDTMLMHHALQPELEKGLGFLGTIYTKELGWKFMRAKHETLKKED